MTDISISNREFLLRDNPDVPAPIELLLLAGLQQKRAGNPALHQPHAATRQPFVFMGVNFAYGGPGSTSTKKVGIDEVIKRRAKNRVQRTSRRVNRQRNG